jgi:hypothetical protein
MCGFLWNWKFTAALKDPAADPCLEPHKCGPHRVVFKIHFVLSSETLVPTYQTAQHHNQEDQNMMTSNRTDLVPTFKPMLW